MIWFYLRYVFMDSYVNSRSPPTISPLVIFIIRDMRIFLSSRAWNNLFSRNCVNMTGWSVRVNVLRILHFDWNVFDWSIFINFKLALKCFNITMQQWIKHWLCNWLCCIQLFACDSYKPIRVTLILYLKMKHCSSYIGQNIGQSLIQSHTSG